MQLGLFITVGLALGFVVSLALELVVREFDQSPLIPGLLSGVIGIVVPMYFVFDGTDRPWQTTGNQIGATVAWVAGAILTAVVINILWPRKKR